MSIFKKVSAGLLCAAMTVTLSSCNLGGPDSSYAAVINGQKIPAGVFISMQYDAYYNAMSYVDPAQTTAETTTAAGEAAVTTAAVTTAFADKTIEGKGVREWINDEATKEMQKYAAIESKFDELGLAFNDNEPQKVQLYIESLWEYYGPMYEGFGVSQDSINLVTLNSEKKNYIFKHYYGAGGEKEVSEADIRQYLTENNARINYIPIALKDSEGNLLKSEGKAEMQAKADEYIERAKNGEDFNALVHEYADSLIAESDADSETTAEIAASAEEDHSQHSHNTIITKTGVTPDAAIVDKIFSGSVAVGDYFTVESTNGETLFVVHYLDLFSDETYYETNYDAALTALKGEEFEAEVEVWASAQTVERNQAAYDRYKYEKFESASLT
ncbi:MAG: peptidylprolyl isomerase [Oscillospiraceae bacterium]|nr:peptidylprolyl isomerase [Oscillospiraceae bacterium]